MPAARLHLHLFGLFRLLQDDQPVAGFDQARLQQLLAYLVLQRAAQALRRRLACVLWTDSTGRQALKNLRTLLARFCQALPAADEHLAVIGSRLAAPSPAQMGLAETTTVIRRKFGSAGQAQACGQAETLVARGLEEPWQRQHGALGAPVSTTQAPTGFGS